MEKKRVSKHWNLNPKINVEKFNLEEVDESNLINHLLKLKQTDITFSFMMNILGNFDGKSLCKQYDTFDVPIGAFSYLNKKGKLVSNKNKFTTTIGIWIFNVFFLRDFGFSFLFNGYINDNIDEKKFNKINQTLVYALCEDKIDGETYKKFLDYGQYFMPFETILSPNHTEKILGCTKEIQKKKAELAKKYEEGIKNGDPVIGEKMSKELLEYAKEILKDDPSLDVYDSGAGGTFKNNFKNMYVMKGAVRNPDPNAKQEFTIATSNFLDGVSADEYSLIANALAAGPYARAKKTEIGGYWEKLFVAAFQTISLDGPDTDCGSNKYIEVELTEKNLSMYMYNYIIKSDGSLEELTSDNSDKYIGKKVKMRFSIFCKSKTGICNKCAGNFFYRVKVGNLGLATVQIPTALKLKSMKAFHDSTINTTEIDPMKAFGLK
jgi:hypothetical protein